MGLLSCGFWIIAGLIFIFHKFNTEELNTSGPASFFIIAGSILAVYLLGQYAIWYDSLSTSMQDILTIIPAGIIVVLLIYFGSQSIISNISNVKLENEVTMDKPYVEAQFLPKGASQSEYRAMTEAVARHLKYCDEYLPAKDALANDRRSRDWME